MIKKEKDPKIEKLAGDVFSKMAEIGKPCEDKEKELPGLNVVGPEAAMKELLELEKDNQISDNT